MNLVRISRIAGAILAVGLGTDHVRAGAAAAYQQSARPQPTPLVFGSGVNVVAVPVFVTDKAGRAVGGLSAADFEVEDNGKKTPIVAFQAVDVDDPPSTETVADLPLAVRAAARRQFLLLIDLKFNSLRGVAEVRKASAAFVRESLAPGDLVAAAISSATGMKVLTNFTADHEFVAKAIEGSRSGLNLATDPLGLGNSAPPSGKAEIDELMSDLETQEREFAADQVSHAANAFLNNAVALVQALAPLRGRKQLVLLSASFGEGVWMPTTASYPGTSPSTRATSADANRQTMEKLFKEAGAADVVIHTVDLNGIGGPMNLQQQSAASGAADIRSIGAGSGTGTLVALSHNTGGTYVRPRNDFKNALDEMERVSRRSYVVAFEASADKGGKPNRLKVRVRRDGLTVSHRTTYRLAETAAPRDANGIRLLAAETLAKGLTEGSLRVNIATLPYRDREGKAAVHATVQIDGPALVEAAKGTELAIQIYGYAFEKGRVADSIALNTSIDLTKMGADIRRSGLRVVTAFPVTAPSLDVRFFVRAGTGGAFGSAEQSVATPPSAEDPRWISTPIFLLSRVGNIAIPFQPAGRPRIDIPFRLGSEAFVPDAAPVITTGHAREVCAFVWPATGSAPLEVSGSLVSGGGSTLSVRVDGLRVVTDPDGFDRYVATLHTPDAEPGSYVLRLKFTEPGSNRSTATEAPVRLER